MTQKEWDIRPFASRAKAEYRVAVSPPYMKIKRRVQLFRDLSLLFAAICVSCVWSQQPNTRPTPSPSSTSDAEMHRLAVALGGRWSVRQRFEAHEGMPNGDTGKGIEVWRPGPGARSLIEDIHTQRQGRAETSGLAVIWWDAGASGYRVLWCGSANPRGCVVMSKLAEWHGSEFVIGDEYERDGKKIEYREVFSDLTPTSFVQTIYEGEAGGALKRVLTIRAKKGPD